MSDNIIVQENPGSISFSVILILRDIAELAKWLKEPIPEDWIIPGETLWSTLHPTAEEDEAQSERVFENMMKNMGQNMNPVDFITAMFDGEAFGENYGFFQELSPKLEGLSEAEAKKLVCVSFSVGLSNCFEAPPASNSDSFREFFVGYKIVDWLKQANEQGENLVAAIVAPQVYDEGREAQNYL